MKSLGLIWRYLSSRNQKVKMNNAYSSLRHFTTQKMKFSITDFFSKCAGNCGYGHIYWRNLNGKFNFMCSVNCMVYHLGPILTAIHFNVFLCELWLFQDTEIASQTADTTINKLEESSQFFSKGLITTKWKWIMMRSLSNVWKQTKQ